MISQIIDGIKVGFISSLSFCSTPEKASFIDQIKHVRVVSSAIFPLNLAIRAAGFSPLSLAAKSCFLLPPLVLSSIEMSTQNERLKKWTHEINHHHISSICKAIVVASSIGLIVYGSPVVGSISLAYTVIESAKSKNYIPPAVSKTMQIVGFGVTITSFFISASALKRVGIVAFLVLFKWHASALAKENQPISSEPSSENRRRNRQKRPAMA